MSARDTIRDILVEIALLALASWTVMLFIGAAHSRDGRVPDLGYWTVVLLLCAAYQTAGYLTYRSSKRGRR